MNPLEPASAFFLVTTPILKGRRFCFRQREVRLEFWSWAHADQVAATDEDTLEEGACQPVPLGVVGVIPSGSRVQHVALEAIEHLRPTVRLRLHDPSKLGA